MKHADLALNGGPKTIHKKFPRPVYDEAEVSALAEVLRRGVWGNPEPLYKQPVFQQKNFMCYAIPANVDYTHVCCPVAEKACYEEAVWIMQNAMLGTREDMDKFAEAIRKIQQVMNQM